MMKHYHNLKDKMTILTALLATLFFHSSPALADNAELAKSVMRVCGVEQQLAVLHDSMARGFEAFHSQMDESAYNTLKSSMEKNFSEEALRKSYESVYTSQARDADLKEAMKWYDSPTGKKLSAMERASADPKSQEDMNRYLAGLNKNPPSRARANLIRDFDRAMRATDVYLDIAINVRRSIMLGILSLKKTGKKLPSTAGIQSQLQTMRQQLKPTIEHNNFLSYLYTYRLASDGEIKDYIRFLSSKSGHALTETAFLALNDALETAGRNVGREIESSH